MLTRCPVCGFEIKPEVIPTSARACFECSRCRSQLEIKTAPTSLLILAISLVFASFMSASLRLRGIGFVVAIVALTAMLNYIGQGIYRALRAPRLQKSRPPAKPMRLTNGIHIHPLR